MGRTQRKRLKNKSHLNPHPLDHEENIINLRKFMACNNFTNEINLKLRNFPETGRGVATVKTLHENDVLIRVPYSLMLTYTTLHSVNFFDLFTPTAKLTIHDLLTTFLVMEYHKKDSFWSHYVNSLPPEPPRLPSLLSEKHTELLPADLRLEAKKSRRLLEESWLRVRKSIGNDWTCGCCGKKASCVISLRLYTWGYILVNTRAVYVDPQAVWRLNNRSEVLSDEPCMALCPFLDMFNHNSKAGTRAELIYHQGELVYQLTTLTSYKKYEQVFISYGDHDNVKLVMEYGFFVPGNPYDSIPIESSEVFKVLGADFSDFQYKFIKSHSLDTSLSITETGPSFNLKALLFVAACGKDVGKGDFASVIYSDNYPRHFLEHCQVVCEKLLRNAAQSVGEIVKVCTDCGLDDIIVDFLRYRLNLIKTICSNKQ